VLAADRQVVALAHQRNEIEAEYAGRGARGDAAIRIARAHLPGSRKMAGGQAIVTANPCPGQTQAVEMRIEQVAAASARFAIHDADIVTCEVGHRANGFRIGSDQNGTNQAKGAFDELETFNYVLSATDIASNYQAKANWDSAGTGLPNIWQMNNFGHLGVDSFGSAAGDGLSNLRKLQSKLNPNLFYPTNLGYWRFNNAPGWQDESGLAPDVASGLYPVPSWSGDAVQIVAAQNSALAYPSVRTNGSAVVVCPAHTGTIRFWFKPDWSSFDGCGGQGPGDTVQLIEIGKPSTNATYGWFSLQIDSLGTELTFSTEANGIHTDNASCPISFSTNAWYQIALAYTPTTCALYINGIASSTNGIGVTNLPSQAILQQDFRLGCSWDGCFKPMDCSTNS